MEKVYIELDIAIKILEHLREVSQAVSQKDMIKLEKLDDEGRDLRDELRWIVND